jgi:NDP-sugar pyrophosphorylase family protein
MQIFRLLKAADNAGPPLVAPVATEHHWLTVDNFQIPNAIHPITVDRMAHRSQLTSTVPVAQGRIKVEWGGEVKLLPRSEFGTLHLERGATYVGEGAYIGAGTAIGNSAMAAGAVRNPQPTSPLQLQAIVDLTAAITLLTQSMAGAKSDAQPELKS